VLLKLNFFKFCKALSRRAVQYILMIYDSKYIYIYIYIYISFLMMAQRQRRNIRNIIL